VPGRSLEFERNPSQLMEEEDESREIYYRRFDDDYVPGEAGRRVEEAGVEEDEDCEVRISETDDFDGLDDEGEAEEEAREEAEEEEEGVLYRGHPAWLSYWKSLLLSAGLMVAGVVMWETSGWILFGGLVVTLMAYSYVVMERSMREYVVTQKRVEVIHGLIAKSSEEVRVVDIRAINVRKEGLKGLIGIGSVEFASAGSDGSDVVFEDVMGAHRLKGRVRRLQDQRDAGPRPA
jgi:membrane protein YdbS with pleckstrin-like domain